MKRGRFYDPPFVLKMALLLCLVIIGLAHKKGWMSRTVGKAGQEASMAAPPRAYELKPAPAGK